MRYNRQIQLDTVGVEGQQKIADAKVLIIGVGGLGCPAAQYLVGAGVGTIGLMDHDLVSITNLHRQVLYRESDLGKPKAIVAKERLTDMNSEVNIIAINEALDHENAVSIFSGYDLVIDGSDNFETKYLINDAAILSGKPWVYGSVFKNEGQLSVFNFKDGASYRCIFAKATTENISCETTGVLGPVPGLLGLYQAMEALKIILDSDAVCSDRLRIFNFLNGTQQSINITKKQDQIDRILVNGIIPVQINCRLKDEERVYLDVRDQMEQPRMESNSIIHIPLNLLHSKHGEIPRETDVFVFCKTGKRSSKAIELLQTEYGFKNLHNVNGGIETIIHGT